MRVLLVEDEVRLADTLSFVLRKERFIVDQVGGVAEARDAAAMAEFDLVLLDRTLPDGEGLALVPDLRLRNPGIHIIVLSARGAVEDRVAGLDEGADDYLVKPFSFAELLARVRTILRRGRNGTESTTLRVADLELDLLRRRVTRAGALDAEEAHGRVPGLGRIGPDGDDVMRLVQIRELLDGQGWYDLRQPRLGPDGGTPISQ